ncbi:MAG: tryptophan halogenase family protein [Burkholderiaceae bacterium]
MSDRIANVLVMGGGSAGWLVASLLAADHPDLSITLVESDETPIIGVGEGTWPSMRDSLRRIGLVETEFVRRCQATFKQGSRFDSWMSGRPGKDGDRYFHPFVLPIGDEDLDLVQAWLQLRADKPFADAVTPSVRLCEAGRAPKQAQTPEFAAVTNYGYHFDAGQFGVVLREHASKHLGVRHVVDHVDDVICAPSGDITALQTRRHGNLHADLFIDCSGLAARLIGQHYKIGMKSECKTLFNNAALAIQVPYLHADAPIATCTIATAWEKGWIWDIGLQSRRGVGCVFSLEFADEDEARDALSHYLDSSGAPSERGEARLIQFEPGYREKFWVKNCVAVGLSAGFIEPLEASALALVEMSAQRISQELPMTRAGMDTVSKRFNDDFSYRWSRVIDFLKLHYILSQRSDSAYWVQHRDPHTWTDRLRESLPLWKLRPPARHDFGRIDEVFPAASYQYVLYGMGFQPEILALKPKARANAEQALLEAERQAQRLLVGLPGHRSLINQLTHFRQ